MSIVVDESFVSGIPGGFATAYASLTATYHSGSQAVDLINNTEANGAWYLDGVPASPELDVEVDVELTAMGATGSFFGIYMIPAAGSAGILPHAVFSPTITTTGGIAISNFAWGFGSGHIDGFPVPTGLGLNMRRVLRFRTKVVDGVRLVEFNGDGGPSSLVVSSRGHTYDVRPAILVRNDTVRLHRITVRDDVAALDDNSAVVPITGGAVSRLPTAWPTDTAQGRVIGQLMRHDMYDGGSLEISGTVKIDDSPDIPVSRKVRLFEKQSGRLVRETWSEPVTGAYVFSKLKDQKYFVVSHDHTLYYNAVIKDEIAPEVPA